MNVNKPALGIWRRSTITLEFSGYTVAIITERMEMIGRRAHEKIVAECPQRQREKSSRRKIIFSNGILQTQSATFQCRVQPAFIFERSSVLVSTGVIGGPSPSRDRLSLLTRSIASGALCKIARATFRSKILVAGQRGGCSCKADVGFS